MINIVTRQVPRTARNGRIYTTESQTAGPVNSQGAADTSAFVKKLGELSQSVEGDIVISGNIYAQGNVVAYSSVPGIASSWWGAMPIASATVLGGIKLGANLTYNATTGKVDASAGSGISSWNDLTDKPSTFPPSAHSHAYSSLSGLPSLFSGAYSDLSGKPDLSVYQQASTAINTSNIASQWVDTANRILSDAGSSNNQLQYWNSDTNVNNPSQSWWYNLRMAHGDADTYFNGQLAFDFFADRIKFQRTVNGVKQGWVDLYHTGNFNPALKQDVATAWNTGNLNRDDVNFVANNINVYGSVTAEELIRSSKNVQAKDNGNGYLELATYTGSLPGYSSAHYPTLKSSGNIHFAASGNYISNFGNHGIEVNMGQFQNYANGFKSFNYRGLVGDYDANGTSSKIIWTIGDSWNTIETHYGLGYQYYGGADFGHTYVVRSSGTVKIKLGGNDGHIWGAGSLTMGGNVTAYSDRKLKANLIQLRDVLPSLDNINAYTYNRIDTNNGKRHLGLIAQEVEAYFPELVEMNAGGIRSLNYQNFTAVLLQAIKEQQAAIELLKIKINQ